MDRRLRDLRAIGELTEAAFVARQAEMAGLKRTELALRAQLSDLDAAKRANAEAAEAMDPATRAGADLLWQSWVDSRRSAINLTLARTLAEQSRVRTELARSFGRNHAVGGLAARAKLASDLQRLRRAERDG